MTASTLLNGPCRGSRINLVEERPRITLMGQVYTLVTDPDTGESLNAYALEEVTT